jgi:hypothetical protein
VVHTGQGLGGRPDGKRPLRIPRYKWKYNVKLDLQEVGWEGFERIDLT